jgi:hypothetical protein
MDQQTQANPSATESAERASTPQGPADSTLKHGTDTSRPELARPSPSDMGLLGGPSKPTDPLDFFPPGSPTEVATEGSSPVDPVDSSQGEAHDATHKAMSGVGESGQQVLPQSPHRPHGISFPEPSTAPHPSSKGKLKEFNLDHKSLLTLVLRRAPGGHEPTSMQFTVQGFAAQKGRQQDDGLRKPPFTRAAGSVRSIKRRTLLA